MNEEYSDLIQTEGKSRGPIVDGIFYPDDDKLLKEEIRFLLEEVTDPPGEALGIITPHAALPFSGSLAAVAFKAAAGRKIENVVLIGPVHREERDAVFLTESDSFIIPTGNIKVNKSIVDTLVKSDSCFKKDDIPHFEEHCLEVQLPFIRYLFPEAEIIPMLIGSNSRALLERASAALNKVFRERMEKTLFVVSVNMTTYLPEKEAKDYCEKFLSLLQNCDIGNIYREIEEGNVKSKGIGSVAILLSLAGSASRVRVLRKKDSSKYGCENSNIVCYAAISVDKNP